MNCCEPSSAALIGGTQVGAIFVFVCQGVWVLGLLPASGMLFFAAGVRLKDRFDVFFSSSGSFLTGFNGTVGASAWPNVLELATAGSGVLNVVLNVTVPGLR